MRGEEEYARHAEPLQLSFSQAWSYSQGRAFIIPIRIRTKAAEPMHKQLRRITVAVIALGSSAGICVNIHSADSHHNRTDWRLSRRYWCE